MKTTLQDTVTVRDDAVTVTAAEEVLILRRSGEQMVSKAESLRRAFQRLIAH